MIRKKNQTNDKINKSKEIIKKEKEKIKEEKKKIKLEKQKKFYSTRFGKLLKAIFLIPDEEQSTITIKSQIFSMLYFELFGAVICILILFILSGGRNFIKLYAELSKFINVYDTVTSNYYGELDKEQMIDQAIESMLSITGDNYTTYTDQENTSSFLENLSGTYEGIGCTVTMDENGNIIIIEVFEDSPAQEAGLKENDIIKKIDGTDYTQKTSEDMANYIKENNSQKITLTISRDEKEQDIVIVREKIEVPTVSSEVFEQDGKKIGYMDISIFSAVTSSQFETQLKKLEKQDIQGLIIDVRNDTGGYLTAVTDITNLFLKKGKIIYQLEDNKNIEKVKDTTKESRDYPIAVLVNSSSASASEILASAIKESYGGFVVGTTTYGKGTVQKTKQLSDGSMIKYTVQKWLTPDGNWINEKGVTPTHEVELESNNDNQLQTALKLIAENCK